MSKAGISTKKNTGLVLFGAVAACARAADDYGGPWVVKRVADPVLLLQESPSEASSTPTAVAAPEAADGGGAGGRGATAPAAPDAAARPPAADTRLSQTLPANPAAASVLQHKVLDVQARTLKVTWPNFAPRPRDEDLRFVFKKFRPGRREGRSTPLERESPRIERREARTRASGRCQARLVHQPAETSGRWPREDPGDVGDLRARARPRAGSGR